MSKHIGIPIKVLHDAEGHTVTVELKTGEVFRGKLDEAEDNMNVHLSNCTKTAKDGRVSTLSKCVALRNLRALHAALRCASAAKWWWWCCCCCCRCRC
jgi:small nuclear ribonucleoprotein (snRNP)-like protein